MIEVRIPKEITEYKEKVIFGLSIRQLIFFTLTIILSLSSYFILTKKLGLSMDSASYVIIIESLPLLAIDKIKIENDLMEGGKKKNVKHFKEKQRKREQKNIREATLFISTKKDKKRKRKKTLQQIKRARKDYRKAKQAEKKKIKKTSTT